MPTHQPPLTCPNHARILGSALDLRGKRSKVESPRTTTANAVRTRHPTVPARTRLLNEVQRAGREAAAYGIMLTVQKKNRFYTKHGIDDLKVAEDGADFEIRALCWPGMDRA